MLTVIGEDRVAGFVGILESIGDPSETESWVLGDGLVYLRQPGPAERAAAHWPPR